MSQKKLKTSAGIFNDYPALLIYPLLCVIAILVLVWFFPYIKVYKFLVHDWLSFVPNVVKVCFAFMIFYLALNYVISFFRAALIAASVLRIEKMNYSIFDGFIEVFKAFKCFVTWVLFDVAFFPIWDAVMKKMHNIPNQIESSVGELAAWKLRDFAVPVMIFEKLMPHKAVERALDITVKKGVQNLLGDLGWGIVLWLLFVLGFVLLGVIDNFFGKQIANSLLPMLFSYFAIVWVFYVVNNAIRIAQIYALDKNK